MVLIKLIWGLLFHQRERPIRERFTQSLDEGAKAVEGGGRLSQFNKGWFVAPTVLIDCNDEMSIFNNESFGPVAPICKVSSFEEAMEKQITLDMDLVLTFILKIYQREFVLQNNSRRRNGLGKCAVA